MSVDVMLRDLQIDRERYVGLLWVLLARFGGFYPFICEGSAVMWTRRRN